jgi:anti-sigma-K factor RskA
MTPTTDHDALRELVGVYLVGALEESERRAFEEHLASCDECRDEMRHIAPAVAALPLSIPQVDPPARLRERVLAVGQERVARPTPAIAPRPETSAVAARGWVGWLAAAAALALAIGLGALSLQLRARVQLLESRLADADARLAQSDALVAEARHALTEARNSVAVLMAPDLTRVDLAGQPPAAGAAGRAFWSPSRGLVFTATRLPAPPAGKTYQLWVVTKEAPVSAGLLTPDPQGRVSATFEPPSGVTSPVAMAVTLEPEGGVPAPTGEKYLVGLVGT